MPKRDIIVIGASAGGVEALLKLIHSLPKDINASIFIVLHLAPFSESNLPNIINRACGLKASHPKDGEEIKPGHIYVAPPDHHLLFEKGNRIGVKKGPMENRFRPSVDALFRSAALIHGPRIIGIILSGLLDDGTSGMWNIQRCGGTTIVQEPADALYPGMPKNVLQYVEVDQMLPVSEMSSLLARLTKQKAPKRPSLTKEQMELLKMEVAIARQNAAFDPALLTSGKLTGFTCPECKTTLISIQEGEMIRFRCSTGHAFTTSSLLACITVKVEEKLWEAVEALEANSMLLKQISNHYKTEGNYQAAKEFKQKADEMSKRSRIIHASVYTPKLLSGENRFEVE